MVDEKLDRKLVNKITMVTRVVTFCVTANNPKQNEAKNHVMSCRSCVLKRLERAQLQYYEK